MSTEVKILGKTYAVRTDHDPDFALQTAKLVDSRMRELMTKAGPIPTEKVAILTAMNFAGELLKNQKDSVEVQETLKEKTKKLIKLIDTEL